MAWPLQAEEGADMFRGLEFLEELEEQGTLHKMVVMELDQEAEQACEDWTSNNPENLNMAVTEEQIAEELTVVLALASSSSHGNGGMQL